MIPEGAGPTIEENPIGTGPFKVESFDAEGTTRLVANETYWEGRPLLDAIQFIAIPDSEARNQAMLAGQLDMNTITRDQAALYADNPAFQVQSFPSGGWFGIVFRTDTAPFDNAAVRRALRIAVDRQAMMTLMVGETGGTIGCDTPVRADDLFRANLDCPQDIEGAKALLAEAGYPEGIDIELVTSDLEPGMVRFAEVYQAQVAPAGIRVALNLAPADGYWDDVWMTAPASVTSWGERPADQILNEAWRTGSSWNESYYANAVYDQTLDQARASLDEATAKALYVQAQELLFQDGGTFIPYQENSRQVLAARVRGIAAVGEDHLRWHLVDLVE
jgi:peptide/nickel transport system substrate-binding protein